MDTNGAQSFWAAAGIIVHSTWTYLTSFKSKEEKALHAIVQPYFSDQKLKSVSLELEAAPVWKSTREGFTCQIVAKQNSYSEGRMVAEQKVRQLLNDGNFPFLIHSNHSLGRGHVKPGTTEVILGIGYYSAIAVIEKLPPLASKEIDEVKAYFKTLFSNFQVEMSEETQSISLRAELPGDSHQSVQEEVEKQVGALKDKLFNLDISICTTHREAKEGHAHVSLAISDLELSGFYHKHIKKG